jgi:hypothetical protein
MRVIAMTAPFKAKTPSLILFWENSGFAGWARFDMDYSIVADRPRFGQKIMSVRVPMAMSCLARSSETCSGKQEIAGS